MFIPFRRKPSVINFAASVLVSLTMGVLGVVMIARSRAVPTIPLLPERYLPGNPFPKEALCSPDDYGNYPCIVYFQNKRVSLAYSEWTERILFASISASEYTLGELVTAWGTPTGINHVTYYTFVYWGTRAAFLNTRSIHPDSRVDSIMYRLEPEQSLPWRGFTSSKGRDSLLR